MAIVTRSHRGRGSKAGEPRQYDKNFKGPIDDRSCTDIICCLIFLLCVLLLLLCGIIAVARGDPRRIIYPTNSDGQICGADVPDRPKLVYFDFLVCARMGVAALSVGCPTPQVCVRRCPMSWWSWLPAHARELASGEPSVDERRQMFCLGGRDGLAPENRNRSIRQLVQQGQCAPFTVPSADLLGRCLPRVLQDISGQLAGGVDQAPGNLSASDNETVSAGDLRAGAAVMSQFVKIYGVLQAMFQDVVASWQLILAGFALSVLLCLLWLLLLRYTARVMVYVSIVGFVLIFLFLLVLSACRYARLRRQSQELEEKLKLTTDIGYYSQLSSTWLVMLIMSGTTLAIVLLLLIWLRQRISIAIAIIAETSKCVARMLSVLLFPILPFVLQLAALALFIVLAMHIGSMGQPEMAAAPNATEIEADNTSASADAAQRADNILRKFTPCDPTAGGRVGSACRFVKYGESGNSSECAAANYTCPAAQVHMQQFAPYMHAYNLFMFFWLINFIDALCQMTLAGAFASYYFAFDKSKDLPAFPLLQSFWRCIRYHMGSLAFGSLIIAVIQIIRVALEYVDKKLKGAENPIAMFVMKCLKCCFWCLEKFMKFLNRNAYILVAIYGRNFCLSAKDAFFLILRNVVRVAVLDQITDFVLFISKLVIVGIMGALAFFFFDGTLARHSDIIGDFTPEDMDYYFVPVIIIMLFTYSCSCLFFSVYSMGVDTIFLCFLEDLERNDGSAEKPYFMPHELMDILGKRNRSAADAPGDDKL